MNHVVCRLLCVAPLLNIMSVLSLFSHVQLFVIQGTVACQAPLSMGFSRQEYWSALPCPRLGNLPDPGIKPMSLTFPTLAGVFFTTEPPGKPAVCIYCCPNLTLNPRLMGLCWHAQVGKRQEELEAEAEEADMQLDGEMWPRLPPEAIWMLPLYLPGLAFQVPPASKKASKD